VSLQATFVIISISPPLVNNNFAFFQKSFHFRKTARFCRFAQVFGGKTDKKKAEPMRSILLPYRPKMPSDSLINALRLAGGRRRIFFAIPRLVWVQSPSIRPNAPEKEM